MTLTPQLPILSPPPRGTSEWTQEYANQLNRWLENLARLFGGIYYLRGSGLYLSPDSLPVGPYGLYPGEVWANDGILTWVREGDIGLSMVYGTGTVGSVTVTIT